jgi:hypothetical protein
MKEIKLPSNKEFLNNFILQRTGAFLELGGSNAFGQWQQTGQKDQLADFLHQNKLTQSFLQKTLSAMFKEMVDLIKTFDLKSRLLTNMVSIGPGNGLLEYFLIEELNKVSSKFNVKKLVLIDVEETETHEHMFKETGSGYASLNSTKKFMEMNDLQVEITLLNPQKEPMPTGEFQICFSFLSMGFHYPCDEYESYLINAVPGSLLVLDKRRGVPDVGFEKISKAYNTIGSINNGKADRFGLEKLPLESNS